MNYLHLGLGNKAPRYVKGINLTVLDTKTYHGNYAGFLLALRSDCALGRGFVWPLGKKEYFILFQLTLLILDKDKRCIMEKKNIGFKRAYSWVKFVYKNITKLVFECHSY